MSVSGVQRLWFVSVSPRDPLAAPLLAGLGERPVTCGAICRFYATTAEPERIWTDTAHRRRGYAKALLTELGNEITERGYRRVYPTTGDRQPQAPPTESEVYPMAFVKELS
jgi:GNAT superfamily N-acetyltransferase